MKMDGGVDADFQNGQYTPMEEEETYGLQPGYNSGNLYGQQIPVKVEPSYDLVDANTGSLPVKVEGNSYDLDNNHMPSSYPPYGGNGYYQTSLQQALNQEFGTNHVTPIQIGEPYGMQVQGNGSYELDASEKKFQKLVSNGENICDICNKQFSSMPSLKRHRETHTGQKRFSCELCGNCYTQKHNLTKHMRLHTGEKPYKCNMCDKAFYIHHHLKNHMVQHTGDYPFTCPVCGRGFKHKNKMEAHALSHEKSAEEGMTAQSPPSVGLNSEENSMSEVWDNTSENLIDESEDYPDDMLGDSFDEEIRSEEHGCEICQQIFISMESLSNHIKLKHKVLEEFKCEECGSIFLSQEHLVRHSKTHKEKAKFRCDECNVSFRFKVSLHIHMRRHNNDYKKHECNLCNKYFLSKASLKKHLNEHYGLAIYQCDECGEEFNQKSEFKSHVISHNEKQESPKNKPCCKTCHKVFSSNSSLRKHEYIHLAVKPYKCDICSVSFAQKIQLRLHNKRHNGGVMEPLPAPPPKDLLPSPDKSPKKTEKTSKKHAKVKKVKVEKPVKEEVVPERRNAPRKARNALREKREEEDEKYYKNAKLSGRKNTPRKARSVVKEAEEEEDDEEDDQEADGSEDSDSSDNSSSSDSEDSDSDSDSDESEDEKEDEAEQADEKTESENANKSRWDGYVHPVCEKCNQQFKKKSALRRHQKSCR